MVITEKGVEEMCLAPGVHNNQILQRITLAIFDVSKDCYGTEVGHKTRSVCNAVGNDTL